MYIHIYIYVSYLSIYIYTLHTENCSSIFGSGEESDPAQDNLYVPMSDGIRTVP